MDINALIRSSVAALPDNPLGTKPNLTLTFRTAGTSTGETDAVGNPILNESSVVLKAIVHKSNIQSDAERMPGSDLSVIPLDGYLYSPKILPASIRVGQKADALYVVDPSKPTTPTKYVGEFVINFLEDHPENAIAQKMGSYISGVFTISGGA